MNYSKPGMMRITMYAAVLTAVVVLIQARPQDTRTSTQDVARVPMPVSSSLCIKYEEAMGG
jgi:hypothetical protein